MSEFWKPLSLACAELDWLDPPPVYIGGAVIPFYLDAFGQAQMRPTLDVDCIVPSVCTYLEFSKLENELRQRGWRPDLNGPICRYLGPGKLVVDFMPVTSTVLGFAGRWYVDVVKSAKKHELPDGQIILLPDVGVLLALKLEAFFDRGTNEPYESKDLEDIVALFDGCFALEESVANLSSKVRLFVRQSLTQIISNEFYLSVAESQLPRGGDEEVRVQRFRDRLTRIAPKNCQ